MTRRTSVFRREARNEKGIALILTAMFMSVLFIAGSFSIDLGGRAQQKRNDHLIADMAALDAIRGGVTTSGLATAKNAQASAKRNNWFTSSAEYLNVIRGVWKLTGSTYAFSPEDTGWKVINGTATPTSYATGGNADAPFNAVQVQSFSPYQDLFQARNPTVTLSASSVAVFNEACGNCATTTTFAAPLLGMGQFRLGSTLLSVSTAQSTLLNSFLAPYLSPLGLSSNLDAVGYQGLASNTTTLGALGTALGFSALTPDQILTSSVKLSSLLAAETSILGTGSLASCSSANASCSSAEVSALRSTILNTSFDNSTTVVLGSVLGLSSGSGAALDTSVNLLDLLVGGMELANGSAAISIPSLAINAGIATVATSLSAITPAKLSPYGLAPQSAQNTQVTATFTVTFPLSVSLLGLGYLLNVSLPVTVTAGKASATMTAVGCPAYPLTTPTGLTIGPLTFSPASETVAGTVSVIGLGTANLTGSQPVVIGADGAASHALTYTSNFITNSNPPGPTAVSVGSASTLPTSISLTASGSGLLGTLATVVNLALPTIQTTLGTALTAVNSTVLTPLLTTLGAQIGKADLLGWRATCPGPMLVGG